MKKWIVATVLLLATPALACPNCKDSVATPVDDAQASSAAGFNRAITVMLGASAIGVLGMGALFVVSRPRPNVRQQLQP